MLFPPPPAAPAHLDTRPVSGSGDASAFVQSSPPAELHDEFLLGIPVSSVRAGVAIYLVLVCVLITGVIFRKTSNFSIILSLLGFMILAVLIIRKALTSVFVRSGGLHVIRSSEGRTAVLAGRWRAIDPTHFQLMLMDRDFTAEDYERLLTLDESVIKNFGATDRDISRLPAYTVSEQHLTCKQLNKCSICLEPVQIGETMRVIPCLHQFHQQCVDNWLRIKAECPICKFTAFGA